MQENICVQLHEHLFSTPYKNANELTILSLLGYLNLAMPTDKHKHFDTAEVVKAMAAMQEKGMMVIGGDLWGELDEGGDM